MTEDGRRLGLAERWRKWRDRRRAIRDAQLMAARRWRDDEGRD
jgi:hypothetical protein